jgi:hypothetical protein
VTQPLLLGRVVRYFENDRISYNEAVWSAIGVVGCSTLFVTINHLLLTNVIKTGMRMRIASCALMYKKVYLFKQFLNFKKVIIFVKHFSVNEIKSFCIRKDNNRTNFKHNVK